MTFLFFKIYKQRAQLVTNFQLLDWRFVPLIIVSIAINYFISSIRWKSLLSIYPNTKNVSVWYLNALYFMGSFFNNFMPTSIGGDVYKVYRLGKKIGNTTDAFSATFMERFTGVISLVLISIISLYKIMGYTVILFVVWFFLAILIGYKILGLVSRKYTKLGKIYTSLSAYNGNWKVWTYSLLTSFVVQLMSILSQYLVFYAIGVKIPIFYALGIFPVINLIGFIIPSLGSFGVQDTAYASLFALIGITAVTSLSASILFHAFRLFTSLIGGLLYLLVKD